MDGNTQKHSTQQRAARALIKWMWRAGIRYSDALQFFSPARNNTGIRTLSDLSAGDSVATIPKSACLTARNTAIADTIDEHRLGGNLGLAVALMYEKSIGERSGWFEYLAALPEREDVPFVWGPAEVDRLLKGTELHQVVSEDHVLMRQDWRDNIWPLTDEEPTRFFSAHFTFERYLDARSLIASRAFSIDDYHGFGMVPLADLFNHKTAAEDVHFTAVDPEDGSDGRDEGSASGDGGDASPSSAGGEEATSEEGEIGGEQVCGKGGGAEERADLGEGEEGGGGGRGESEDEDGKEVEEEEGGHLEMILVKDVGAGQQIFNTYGELSTAALLHRYGFTEPNNPFDMVNLDLELVLKAVCRSVNADQGHPAVSSRHARHCVRLCAEAGCAPLRSPGCTYFEIDSTGTPQWELLFLLRVMFLPENKSLAGLPARGPAFAGQLEELARAVGWEPQRPAGSNLKKRKRMVEAHNAGLPCGGGTSSEAGQVRRALRLRCPPPRTQPNVGNRECCGKTCGCNSTADSLKVSGAKVISRGGSDKARNGKSVRKGGCEDEIVATGGQEEKGVGRVRGTCKTRCSCCTDEGNAGGGCGGNPSERKPEGQKLSGVDEADRAGKELQEDLERWLLSSDVCHCMLEVLKSRDELYPSNTSLELDRARLVECDGMSSPREYHALSLRVSERHLLAKCKKWILKYAEAGICSE